MPGRSSRCVMLSVAALTAALGTRYAYAQDASAQVIIRSSEGTTVFPAYGRAGETVVTPQPSVDAAPSRWQPPTSSIALPDQARTEAHLEGEPRDVAAASDDHQTQTQPTADWRAAPALRLIESGPVTVAYVVSLGPPKIQNQTLSKAVFDGWLLGPILTEAAGGDLGQRNHIDNPVTPMAKAIASAFAARNGGAAGPIGDLDGWTLTQSTRNKRLAARAGSARYVVDVATSAIFLTFFSMDITKFDVSFGSRVMIIDTATSKTVAKASCLLWPQRDQALPYDQWLADDAAALKKRIAQRAGQCIQKMEGDLALPIVEQEFEHSSTRAGMQDGRCDERKMMEAVRSGAPCSALREYSGR